MRYTRQELKHDRFSETAAGVVHSAVENRQKLITYVVIAGVIIAAIVVGFWYSGYRSDKAAAALGDAMQVYGAPVAPAGAAPPQVTTFPTDQDRLTAAKNAFYGVSSQYGSTRSGKYARYMAGICEEGLGNNQVAEQNFKAIADGGDKDTSSLAKLALAALYLDTNRQQDAVNLYKQLIDHPTDSVPKVSAQMQLADAYAPSNPAEAKKIYAQVQTENQKSAVAELAQQKSAELK